MKIVKILNEIYVKMQDNRFREDIPAEQVICLFRKELEELAEETQLNLHETLILSGHYDYGIHTKHYEFLFGRHKCCTEFRHQ